LLTLALLLLLLASLGTDACKNDLAKFINHCEVGDLYGAELDAYVFSKDVVFYMYPVLDVCDMLDEIPSFRDASVLTCSEAGTMLVYSSFLDSLPCSTEFAEYFASMESEESIPTPPSTCSSKCSAVLQQVANMCSIGDNFYTPDTYGVNEQGDAAIVYDGDLIAFLSSINNACSVAISEESMCLDSLYGMYWAYLGAEDFPCSNAFNYTNVEWIDEFNYAMPEPPSEACCATATSLVSGSCDQYGGNATDAFDTNAALDIVEEFLAFPCALPFRSCESLIGITLGGGLCPSTESNPDVCPQRCQEM
jgi:hypothetical protein